MQKLAIVFLLSLTVPCMGSEVGHIAPHLKLVDTGARLPSARGRNTALYDGHDTIWSVAGFSGGQNFPNDTVRYSLDTGAVTPLGIGLGDLGRSNGGAVLTDEGILYFGGARASTSYSDVLLISTDTGAVTVVQNLPSPMSRFATVWDPVGKTVYLLGGRGRQGILYAVFAYNSTTRQVANVGQLKIWRSTTAAVWDQELSVAYLFGGESGTGGSALNIMKYDPQAKVDVTINPLLRFRVYEACAVYVRGNMFIVTDKLLRFLPSTGRVETLYVEGWPTLLQNMGCVYVEKLARIYILGGYRQAEGESKSQYIDDIQYVDISTLLEPQDPARRQS